MSQRACVALLALMAGVFYVPASGVTGYSTARAMQAARPIPATILLRIVRAEDERRWDNDLAGLMFDRNPRVRSRAALAAGRIGDERAVPALLSLLQSDREMDVRAMAAFALGEAESASSADALIGILRRPVPGKLRSRVVEALGKIAASLPKTDEARAQALGEALLKALASEAGRSPRQDKEAILLGLTAVLRARPANAGPVVARFLADADARIRADAANTLARLRAKEANAQLRLLLVNDADPIVRANAARALGAAEDKDALDALMARSINDTDERVRVSAIRSLGALKDARGGGVLLQRAAALFAAYRAAKTSAASHPRETNEMLEIASALGRILANTGDARAVNWLREFREAEGTTAPEIEIAFAHIAPSIYLREKPFSKLSDEPVRARIHQDWRYLSSIAQGLGEVAAITAAEAGNGIIGLQADAQMVLRSLLDDAGLPPLAIPDMLRALAAFKASDLGEALRKQLGAKDVIVRATVAELLGGLPPDEANAGALAAALPVALQDAMNDAALAILDALAKQKSQNANEAIKTALNARDHLIRRRAVALLQANGAGDFSSSIQHVASRNTELDYQRALSRRGKRVQARVETDKGAFTIELLPDVAPLTVDNFVQLARRGFFNGIAFHRVVPNFVIQGGDPRGDGNGGPDYQIRCEINEVPYERGAVGMALSGKDTGGSQWFVTHSPQPHLDGGYTVFGRVMGSSMNVVDAIVRGDRIRNINITEGGRSAAKMERQSAGVERKKRT